MCRYCSLIIVVEILTCRLCTLWESLVISVWQHHFFKMVTEPCKWLSDVVFCTFWYFHCSTVYLYILFDGSVSWTQQSVVQAGGGCLSDLYDNTDSIALYMLAAPDFLTLNVYKTIATHRNSSQLIATAQRISISSRTTLCHWRRKFHESTHRSCKTIIWCCSCSN